MQSQPFEIPWDAPAWQGEAEAWIVAQGAAHGYTPTGAVEWVHKRAWSAFARVATERGTIYFKAPAPPSDRFEAPLAQELWRWRPDCSLPVIAVNLEEGWMLTADAGVTMNAKRDKAWQMPIWLKLLPFHAEFQMEMVEHVPELLAMGVPDRRLAALPAQYNALMEDHDNLRVGGEDCLTKEQYQALRDKRSTFADMCEELASYGLPETLTHEEIHDSNVIMNGERVIFNDWGDSSVAHPFFTMVNTLRSVTDRIGIADDGVELQQMRDAYLEPWTTFGTHGQLMTALGIAYRLGMVNRALSWQQGTGQLAEQHKGPYVYAVSAWLQDFLNGDGIG